MKNREFCADVIVSFFIITACITIAEGVLGIIFTPDMQMGPDGFLVPPILGFLTALTGFVVTSKRVLSVREMLFRHFLQLLLIEGIVLGLNLIAGTAYSTLLWGVMALSVVVVYVLVYLVIWLSEYRSACVFNRKLREWQRENGDEVE